MALYMPGQYILCRYRERHGDGNGDVIVGRITHVHPDEVVGVRLVGTCSTFHKSHEVTGQRNVICTEGDAGMVVREWERTRSILKTRECAVRIAEELTTGLRLPGVD